MSLLLLVLRQDVSYDDEDVYHCLASNKFGSAGFSTSLVVRSKILSYLIIFHRWNIVTATVNAYSPKFANATRNSLYVGLCYAPRMYNITFFHAKTATTFSAS